MTPTCVQQLTENLKHYRKIVAFGLHILGGIYSQDYAKATPIYRSQTPEASFKLRRVW